MLFRILAYDLPGDAADESSKLANQQKSKVWKDLSDNCENILRGILTITNTSRCFKTAEDWWKVRLSVNVG